MNSKALDENQAGGSTSEEILEADLKIVDPHHHLWQRTVESGQAIGAQNYLVPELLRDLGSGHNIRSTVYIECRSKYRTDGKIALQPVGETEWVHAQATRHDNSGKSHTRICAGIIPFADLCMGSAVSEVLEAHLQASDRIRGIRHWTAWDSDTSILGASNLSGPQMLRNERFREGFACLQHYGLSYDAWVFHPQLAELDELAAAFPNTTIVMDHVGTPLGSGVYAGRRNGVFDAWRAGIKRLASRSNVVVKLGGLGMPFADVSFLTQSPIPSSATLAVHWRPYIETCIEAFGVERCMFESNFPVDLATCSYRAVWNAFKRIAAGYSTQEKAALFSGTASRVYRLAPAV